MLVGAIGCKHLLDSFCVGRVVNMASEYLDLLLVTNPDSAGESVFNLSICGLVDIFFEVNPECESWAGIGIVVGNWC